MIQDFEPDYPNEVARRFRDEFVAGAYKGGLSNIPDAVLSWAIDRAIAARKPAREAGSIFADTYYSVHARRAPHGGYGSPTAYLLKVFENQLGE